MTALEESARVGGVEEYLDDTVRLWTGLPRSAPLEVPRLPDRLARLLLRAEEHENGLRDQWGSWEFAYSENFREGHLWRPEVDEWVAQRRAELSLKTRLEPLWPAAHPFVICLTHDIDRVSRQSTPRQIMRIAHASFAGAGGDSRLNSGTARVARVLREVGAAVSRGVTPVPATSETLEPCIAIEQRKGVTASYFFAVYPPTRLSPIDCVYDPGDRCLHQGKRVRIRDVVRLLVDAGFDVGLHGSYHTATHGSELEAQKARLEEVAGANVTTTRQHWLHWDVRLTPILHERAGLLSDSTLGFNRNVGFRAGTSMPFFHFDLQAGRRLDLVQVPIAVHDVPLIEVNGLELDHGLARDVTRQLLDSVAAVNGVATVLFHPDHLGKRDFRSLLEWTIDYGLDRGAWVTSVREIDRWWRARAKRILGPGADIEHGSSRVRN